MLCGRGSKQTIWRRRRWAGVAACCGAAASALALGALTAGAAVAQSDAAGSRPVIASVITPVIAGAPLLIMAPPAPTDAQRAVALEAARLAVAHPVSKTDLALLDGQLGFARPVQRPGEIASFIDLGSYGLGPVKLDDGIGTIMHVALRLYLAGHEAAVRDMAGALSDTRHPYTEPARHAVPVLLGNAPPPQIERHGAEQNDFAARAMTLAAHDRVTAVAMALAALAERALWSSGQVEPARPLVRAAHDYTDAGIAATLPDPSQFNPDSNARAQASIMNWLVAAGRLEDAFRLGQDRGLPANCTGQRGYGELWPLMDNLAVARQWPQLMELVAASNRHCLEDILVSRVAALARDAGQGDALLAALRTALARPVSRDSSEPVLVEALASRGFLEEAEQEIAASRAAGKLVTVNSRAVLAAAAVVRGDRPMLDRHWNALDQVTNGEADALAEQVVVAAVMAGMATGDWRGRAVDWLGVDEADLDRALSIYVRLIDPGAARRSPALAALVSRALAARSEPEGWPIRPFSAYRLADLQLVVWNREQPLLETAWFRSLDVASVVDLADAAAGWYNDPALLEQLLTLVETRAWPIAESRGSGPAPRRDWLLERASGRCFVAVRALDQPGAMPKAVAMLARADLFQDDRLQNHCRVRAAAVLALRGHADDAMRVARATVDPSARALALAYSLAAPLPPELVAWHDRMRGRGPVAEIVRNFFD